MEIYELKIAAEQRRSKSMTECGMFFAFSDKQFEENKTPLDEGDKYVRLFGGAFIPKSLLTLKPHNHLNTCSCGRTNQDADSAHL